MAFRSVTFRWSDAWLMLAIGYVAKKEPAPLAQVVGAADAIQHAILTWEEADGGLFRLGKAGYTVIRDGRIGLTVRGQTLLSGLDARMVLDRQDQLAAALKALPGNTESPTSARDNGQPEIISRTEFEVAVKQYVGNPTRTMRGM